MNHEEDQGLSPEQVEQTEQEARAMGWVPEEEFKGKKDHWVDAATFVERGNTLMPILRQNNRRLQQELLTAGQKIDTLAAQLKGAQTAINRLEDHYSQANKRAVETAKNQLKEELKQAREDRDVDREVQILDGLDKIRKQEDALEQEQQEKKSTPPAKVEDQPAISQEFQDWNNDNPWYGQDKKRTRQAILIAEDLRAEGNTLQGRAFMDEVVRLLEEESPTPNKSNSQESPNTTSKVESSSGRRSTGGGKSFADLPQSAKEACWSDMDDLVGPNKRYKTQKEWENKYAQIYYSEV